MTKYLIICLVLFSSIILYSCKVTTPNSTPNSTPNNESESTNTGKPPKEFTEEEFANMMSEPFINKKFSLFNNFFPNPHLVKQMDPDNFGELSHSEINTNFINPLKERFKANYDKIINEMNEEGIKGISFNSYEVEDVYNKENMPKVLSVKLNHSGDKTASIPITFIEKEKQWYIFEILHSTDIFK